MLEELAFEIAKTAHAGQTDKAGLDYILHPLQVAAEMATDEEKAVALLHDIIEDTDVTADELLAKGLSVAVVEAVEALTKKTDQNYADYLAEVKKNGLATAVTSVSAKGIAKTKSIITNIRPNPLFVMFFFTNGSSMYCLYFSDSTNCLCKRSELCIQKKPVSR